jgi:hypothetical protein
MGDNELVAIVTTIITGAVTVTALTRAYFRSRAERVKSSWGGDPLPGSIEQRLVRIEQAVDAIAVEVERISEGQRFTTKLLAERSGELARVPDASSARGGTHAY